MTKPLVSVIIPCLNEADLIGESIESILRQHEPDGGIEVIVADGMSNDGTRDTLAELARQDSRLRVVDNPGRIVSTGLNAAIREARGEIIIRMDAHTKYAPDYILCCIAALQSSGADNVGGPARTMALNDFQRANALAYHSWFSVGGAKFHHADSEGYVDTVPYGCWRKEVLLRLGLFDEELVRNQDDELNLRLIRAGGKIWQSPQIRSWYFPRSSLRALFTQYMQYGYWKVRVIRKHRLPGSLRHLVPGGFVLCLLALALTAPFAQCARWFLATLLALYACTNLAASLVTGRRLAHWRHLPALPAVFAAYHFGYGWGFFRGILDFVLLKKGERDVFAKLTR